MPIVYWGKDDYKRTRGILLNLRTLKLSNSEIKHQVLSYNSEIKH